MQPYWLHFFIRLISLTPKQLNLFTEIESSSVQINASLRFIHLIYKYNHQLINSYQLLPINKFL